MYQTGIVDMQPCLRHIRDPEDVNEHRAEIHRARATGGVGNLRVESYRTTRAIHKVTLYKETLSSKYLMPCLIRALPVVLGTTCSTVEIGGLAQSQI